MRSSIGRLVVVGVANIGLAAAWTVGVAAPAAAALTCGGQVATIVGTEDPETLNGTAGPDVIVGLGGDDIINGQGGDDRLCGDAGNDTLRDRLGSDLVFGGDGVDTLAAHTSADGADVYNGGPGIDTVTYAARTAAVSLSLDGLVNDGASGGEGDSIVATENLTGGSGGDTLIGGGQANVLNGGGGQDLITDRAGADTVIAGTGDDLLLQGASSDVGDTFNGGAGIDEISYADRTGTVRVTLVGGVDDGAAGEADSVVAVENARGGAGKDTLIGTAGANVLSGSAGNDTITDGLGPDVVLGGDGDDVFLQGAIADPNDEFTGGLGADTISYASRATATRIELHNGQLGNGAPEENDSADQIERATGGSGDDNIVGDGVDNVLRGGAGNDSIVALAGADTLHGDAGDDQLDTTDGTGGNDVSHGGPGDDVFFHDVGDITNQ